MKKVILFRHGEKQKVDSINADDKRGVKLTNVGVEQINKLGRTLFERFPLLRNTNYIYSSHYTRAIQSAEIVKSILNIKDILVIPEFGEFFASENYFLSKEARSEMQKKAMQDPNWISPDVGFSLNQRIEIFKNKIKEICLKDKNNLIVISTHGGIIRNTVYNFEPKLRPNNDVIADSKIHEGGYTVLNFDGENFSVEEFDVCDYLLMQ